MPPITQTDIKEFKKVFSGKVRDIYETRPGEWLIVTTDRISAFDVVFNEGIPDKGKILNQISNKWFKKIDFIGNHIISDTPAKIYPELNQYEGIPERSVLVKKVNRLPVECVVRGTLFGSVFKEYQSQGTAGGIQLPEGLELASLLEEPIFTPASKAESGHDENISFEEFLKITGKEIGEKIREVSIKIYKQARNTLDSLDILLADTKFEFGIDENNQLILVDEVLTPDSSRYWEKPSYKAGTSPKSYDKQFVRDYLNTLDWNKQPPAPALPKDIISKTRDKYLQVQSIIEQI